MGFHFQNKQDYHQLQIGILEKNYLLLVFAGFFESSSSYKLAAFRNFIFFNRNCDFREAFGHLGRQIAKVIFEDISDFNEVSIFHFLDQFTH